MRLAQREALRVAKPASFCIAVALIFCAFGLSKPAAPQTTQAGAPAQSASWQGVVRDAKGNALPEAQIDLRETVSGRTLTATTDGQGAFRLPEVPAGNYTVRVRWHDAISTSRQLLRIRPGSNLNSTLQLAAAGGELVLETVAAGEQPKASGGENLSSRQVSELPLNKRDFSQLLLLAAGTMTDTNGSANFTQQFAVNGQRGSTAMFAMDGVDTTDPELGGATFSNFNIDAVQEIQAYSGVMPAEIGHGAAGFTNIITKAGTNQVHGSLFEFVRNSALDARNFFDERSLGNPGRIPPFRRNEFGFALGGPVTLPGIYHGHDRTFFFGEYQGFRQMLSATEVLSVPTPAERQGLDSTAFPGDTLHVPVSPLVAPAMAGYPLPNDLQGPFGARTYATSTKVPTDTNQFSARIDHRISGKAQMFARFTLNNVNGPLTNPDQAAIDPSFAIHFFDHQRNAALHYSRAISAQFTAETSIGYIRSTPTFISPNHVQPAITFADSLYEPFNAAAGTATGSLGNLFQFRQNFAYVHGTHSFKFGVEMRFNRDGSIFGVNPDGTYAFGGGTAYSLVPILSDSGQHNINAGAPLPDSLTGFLTATPFSYNTTVPAPYTAVGDRFDEVNIHRNAYNFYFQDAWKISPRFTLNYGLRYEANSRIGEPLHRTSTARFVDAEGDLVPPWAPGAEEIVLMNPQPPYGQDWNGWGPRLSAEWQAAHNTVVRAGGAITSILPNLFWMNFLTGGFPFIVDPYLSATAGAPLPFSGGVTAFNLPTLYTTTGQVAVPGGNTRIVPANTNLDMPRFESDLSALTPGRQPQPLAMAGMAPDIRTGYIVSQTASVEQTVKDVVLAASYVGTAGVKLECINSPNGYAGASPEFAHFTQFNSAGQVTGGYGPESFVTTGSHSTYHALQLSASKNNPRLGLGFQTSYTFSKSIDDTSAVVVGYGGPTGTIIQAVPQDPRNPGADKGPSTFDVTQAFTSSLIQVLPLDRVSWLRPLGQRFNSGWQFLNITTLTSGMPFTVYSGIQQTGAGAGGGDRPDQIAVPVFSTSRTIREDYFGRGADDDSFFSVPINLPGGTGPNSGRFGSLGRDTFRGPSFHDLDFALIKDTTLSSRAGSEPPTLEFRGEFFNALNLVNFGQPVNVLRGSGFGLINHTAGTSRQIQFSLKLIF
ncbi:MAG: TonB-dependent receptor [Terriglobia bacterium]|jgi:hypothetical protein